MVDVTKHVPGFPKSGKYLFVWVPSESTNIVQMTPDDGAGCRHTFSQDGDLSLNPPETLLEDMHCSIEFLPPFSFCNLATLHAISNDFPTHLKIVRRKTNLQPLGSKCLLPAVSADHITTNHIEFLFDVVPILSSLDKRCPINHQQATMPFNS